MRAPDLLLPFDLVQNTLSIHSLIYHATYVGLRLYYAGFVSSTFVPDNEGVTLDELDSLTPDSPGTHGDPRCLGVFTARRSTTWNLSAADTAAPFAS